MNSESKVMKHGKLLAILLALGLVLSAPLIAQAKKKPKESQKGGLPALEDRVEQNEGENNWAVVDGSTGTVVRFFSNAGTVTASRTSTGLYDVTFGRDISGCAFEATLGDTGTGTPPIGEVGVAGDAGDLDSVVVQTATSTGVAADASFHLSVSCPGHTGD